MPTALRDMQPWRRLLAEHGLTLRWVAQATGTPLPTVKAYSAGARTAPTPWIERVEAAIRDRLEGVA